MWRSVEVLEVAKWSIPAAAAAETTTTALH